MGKSRGYNCWTPEEEDALRNGVAKHGLGAWEIVRKDPEFIILAHRSGVQLKDKFRNLVKFRHVSLEEAKALKPKGSGPWSRKLSASGLTRATSMGVVCAEAATPGKSEEKQDEAELELVKEEKEAENIVQATGFQATGEPAGPDLKQLVPLLGADTVQAILEEHALDVPLEPKQEGDEVDPNSDSMDPWNSSQRRKRRLHEDRRFGIYDQRRYSGKPGVAGSVPVQKRQVSRSGAGRSGGRRGGGRGEFSEDFEEEEEGEEAEDLEEGDESDGHLEGGVGGRGLGRRRSDSNRPVRQSLRSRTALRNFWRRAAAGEPLEEGEEEGADTGEFRVQCLCGVSYDDGAAMVECERCQVWSHVECLKSRAAVAPMNFSCNLEHYTCHLCLEHQRGGLEVGPSGCPLDPNAVLLPPNNAAMSRFLDNLLQQQLHQNGGLSNGYGLGDSRPGSTQLFDTLVGVGLSMEHGAGPSDSYDPSSLLMGLANGSGGMASPTLSWLKPSPASSKRAKVARLEHEGAAGAGDAENRANGEAGVGNGSASNLHLHLNGSASNLNLNGSASNLNLHLNGSASHLNLNLNGSASNLNLNGSASNLNLDLNGGASDLNLTGGASDLNLHGSASNLNLNGSAAKGGRGKGKQAGPSSVKGKQGSSGSADSPNGGKASNRAVGGGTQIRPEDQLSAYMAVVSSSRQIEREKELQLSLQMQRHQLHQQYGRPISPGAAVLAAAVCLRADVHRPQPKALSAPRPRHHPDMHRKASQLSLTQLAAAAGGTESGSGAPSGALGTGAANGSGPGSAVAAIASAPLAAPLPDGRQSPSLLNDLLHRVGSSPRHPLLAAHGGGHTPSILGNGTVRAGSTQPGLAPELVGMGGMFNESDEEGLNSSILSGTLLEGLRSDHLLFSLLGYSRAATPASHMFLDNFLRGTPDLHLNSLASPAVDAASQLQFLSNLSNDAASLEQGQGRPLSRQGAASNRDKEGGQPPPVAAPWKLSSNNVYAHVMQGILAASPDPNAGAHSTSPSLPHDSLHGGTGGFKPLGCSIPTSLSQDDINRIDTYLEAGQTLSGNSGGHSSGAIQRELNQLMATGSSGALSILDSLRSGTPDPLAAFLRTGTPGPTAEMLALHGFSSIPPPGGDFSAAPWLFSRTPPLPSLEMGAPPQLLSPKNRAASDVAAEAGEGDKGKGNSVERSDGAAAKAEA